MERADNDVVKAVDDINEWNPALRDMINEGDTVIDCGANEGHTTIAFANRVGPKGKVIAIEADPDNVALIKKNVALNGLNNVTVVQKAVSDKSGDWVYFQHEVVQTADGGRLVETVRLDDFSKYKPDVVKIDVEGYELPVVRGAEQLLSDGAKWEVEMHLSKTTGIHMTRRFGYDPLEIMRIFRSHGYKILFNDRLVAEGETPEGCIRCLPG